VLIQDEDWSVIVDCAPGDVLLETLAARGIKEIDALVISHADSDHVGGALGLLADETLVVRRMFVNGDWFKATRTWSLLRTAVRDARTRYGLEVHSQLSTSTGSAVSHGELRLEVVAPTPELLLGSSDRKDLSGRALTSNSLSAVIRLLDGDRRVALFAGDLDTVGLANLQEAGQDLRAELLVFPHHGGVPGSGSNPGAFAGTLCDLVKPSLVVFSISREGHANPKPEIVAEIRKRLGEGRVACTQLSRSCAATVASEKLLGHLHETPSAGRSRHLCCAGSITFLSQTGLTDLSPTRTAHLAFIKSAVPTPMCLGAHTALAPAKVSASESSKVG
jgi:competence protein ComEC